MSKKNSTLTAERLRELMHYDPATGIFTRLLKTRNSINVGGIVGSMNSSGYLLTSIDNERHRMHRLAWLYHYGEWPSGHVDHIDGIKTNNAIKNLRDVDPLTNVQNQRRARVNNKSGFLGVSSGGGLYRASITKNGKQISLGMFGSPDLAHQAYLRAKREMHFGCTI